MLESTHDSDESGDDNNGAVDEEEEEAEKEYVRQPLHLPDERLMKIPLTSGGIWRGTVTFAIRIYMWDLTDKQSSVLSMATRVTPETLSSTSSSSSAASQSSPSSFSRSIITSSSLVNDDDHDNAADAEKGNSYQTTLLKQNDGQTYADAV